MFSRSLILIFSCILFIKIFTAQQLYGGSEDLYFLAREARWETLAKAIIETMLKSPENCDYPAGFIRHFTENKKQDILTGELTKTVFVSELQKVIISSLIYFNLKKTHALFHLLQNDNFISGAGKISSSAGSEYKLFRYFSGKFPELLDFFYQQGQYNMYLKIARLWKTAALASGREARASAYTGNYPAAAEYASSPLWHAAPETAIRFFFIKNEYRVIIEKYPELSASPYYLFSLLAENEYHRYDQLLARQENPLYLQFARAVFSSDTAGFQKLSASAFYAPRLDYKTLKYLNLQTEGIIDYNLFFTFEKALLSCSTNTALFNNLTEKATGSLKNYFIESYLEMTGSACEYEKFSNFFHSMYSELSSKESEEFCMYLAGKIEEKNVTISADSIFKKILYNNPDTFYRSRFFME
ncbi:MAG: hypothetical protein A2096_10735 [Spirochaetes bacterium GWF1_41_5]|nr:MAG: hypothetical protein A2096_10735 [Spirochaetes bacterium GWF1_41_5]HBE01166.1 hypothetical protein [Spirochaetia bacterium]